MRSICLVVNKNECLKAEAHCSDAIPHVTQCNATSEKSDTVCYEHTVSEYSVAYVAWYRVLWDDIVTEKCAHIQDD